MRSVPITGVLVSLVLVGLSPIVAAQTTHLVGPGGFPQIANALAVAAPGDVIRVQGVTTFQGFTTTIGVTIVGTGLPVIAGVTANLPPGQTLHLANFYTPTLNINGGRTTADEVAVTQLCTIVSGELHARGCLFGQGLFDTIDHGLKATSSKVTAINSIFKGRPSWIGTPIPGYNFNSPALVLVNSTFHGSRLTIEGGDSNGGAGAPAMTAANSTMWISDSTLSSGDSPSFSSSACPMTGSGNQGRLVRCALATTYPTFPATCPTVVPVTGPLIGVHQPTAIQSPGSLTLDYRTEPNEILAVFVSFGTGNFVIPGLEQPLLLDPTTAFHLDTFLADALGAASRTWSMPAGLTNQTVFLQAIGTTSTTLPLQLSPLAGGVVR